MSAEKVTRIYGNFRGADFRGGDEINLVRSPDCYNVWKDYRNTKGIQTRPAMELKNAFDGPIYGIFFHNGIMLVHSKDKLYKVVDGEKTELYSGLKEAVSDSFVYESIWYFKDGKHYLQYDGTEIKEVEGYVPTTSIARKPKSGGTDHEDVNMLSPYRINTFIADGNGTEYWLNSKNIDKDFYPQVEIEGEEIPYSVDYDEGIIRFNGTPSEPLTPGKDNITVKFKKTKNEYTKGILNCTLLQVFDNRVFFSGNPDFPNVVWHCSLNDPSYVSDKDFYREGLDDAEIRGLVAGNNALWVFREPSDANTTVFYHTPTIDDVYGKIYPSSHSSVTTGCIGKAVNFNDDIVFFSERGMEGISGDITTEQVLGHRSTLVDSKMIAEGGYKDMILAEWEGYLLVIVGKAVYLADSRAVFTNENHIEYDWFYWEFDKVITCAKVNNGILYLGTEDGVYTLTDNESAVESWWVTPKDKFKYPQMQKTSNKRGCVVEATGDISVYAKIEDTEFELIDKYEGITDYFVSRIKRKKWKDIQLKFYSATRFSLETASLEAFVGGYMKR